VVIQDMHNHDVTRVVISFLNTDIPCQVNGHQRPTAKRPPVWNSKTHRCHFNRNSAAVSRRRL